MRLVDIDSLKGCAIIRPTSSEEIAHIEACPGFIAHKDIPTAYDPEAVVEKLEAKRKGYEEAGKVFNGTHGSGIRLSYALKQGAILEAMEIVRNGGKE